MVSIIMPAYNAAGTISASVESVIAQTCLDWELIIIDDGSADRTAELAAGYEAGDSRIRFLKNEKNMGVSYTRNRAIALARGEWIAFLDSDDLWRPDKLEKQLALIEAHPDMVICYTASSFIDENGTLYDYIMPAEETLTYNVLLRKNLMSCSSVMLRASVMKAIPMPGDHMHEDYYVWLTVLRQNRIAYGINEPLLIYRIGGQTKSSGRIRSAKMLYHSYRAVGYGPFVSVFFLLRYTVHSVRKRQLIYRGTTNET